jgi:hypothetical protein
MLIRLAYLTLGAILPILALVLGYTLSLTH